MERRCRYRPELCGVVLAGLLAFGMPLAQAQDDTLKQILQRLDRLETENRALADEVKSLRAELAAAKGAEPKPAEPQPVEDRLAVVESRVDEQAQTKVEAANKLPLRITGMVLFNSFLNGKFNGGSENPTTAALSPAVRTSGATFRQSILGFSFNAPGSTLGAKVNGSIYFDLFGGTTASLNHLLRLRVATLSLDWTNTTFSFGHDKPIIAPREPESLAQVGVSPLTGAGNLWLWQPQARLEQRFHFGADSGLRAQIGIYQTSEGSTVVPAEYANAVGRGRPALQGRFEVWHRFSEHKRIEFAPGFHTSQSQVAGFNLPSRAFSLDWFVNPFEKLEFTGAFYNGENVGNMGTVRQSFTIFSDKRIVPIHATGGWAQIAIPWTPRLSFHVFGGQHDDRDTDLLTANIAKNQAYFANWMYKIAPNIILSFEGGQVRTSYLRSGTRTNNHYDLALAYQF